MKSLQLLFSCTLFLLLLKYGSAETRWDCYKWTESDLALIYARGGGGGQEIERKVCEDVLGHVFTAGEDSQAPGCGECWCCQEIRWKCYSWTAIDLIKIKSLGGGKQAERQVCDAKEGHVFTAGVNGLTSGCGSCWCCEKI